MTIAVGSGAVRRSAAITQAKRSAEETHIVPCMSLSRLMKNSELMDVRMTIMKVKLVLYDGIKTEKYSKVLTSVYFDIDGFDVLNIPDEAIT